MAISCTLWAVHISDGALRPAVCWAGLAGTAFLMALGAWRLRDEEVPRIALLTAAFFVASQIKLPLSLGPTSAHLLLNSLVGVILGRRAALAIPIGLLFQAVLFGHGGFFTLGVNACVMTLPALLASALFALVRGFPWREHSWFRSALVCLTVMGCALTLVFGVTLLLAFPKSEEAFQAGLAAAIEVTFHPWTLGSTLLLCLLLVLIERRRSLPDFPVGLFLGWLTVLATITLNFLVLFYGGEENWTVPALLMYVAHLPLAVFEGIVLGFTIGFLARVKPEMLGLNGKTHYPNPLSRSLPP